MSLNRRALFAASLVCVLAAGAAMAADSGAAFKKAAKAKSKGTYYLKTNVPYLQGRHVYGTFKTPLAIVTPAGGPKIEASSDLQAGVFHAEARRLSLRVNDPVQLDDVDWVTDDQALDIEVNGTGRAGEGDGVLRFKDMHSLADFEKCWEQAFSDVSIEQKYDWPADIKQAVVERKVLVGMTPEQVMVAVGAPERVTRSTQDGKTVETWVIQRGEGGKMGFWTMKVGDKQEIQIAFRDGKVTQTGNDAEPPAIKLK